MSLDCHLNHISLAVSTEAPPTNFLFVSWSQFKERWLKGLNGLFQTEDEQQLVF